MALLKAEGGRRIAHNPLLNSGALTTSALIADAEKSFEDVMKIWESLCGSAVGFCNRTFLSELNTAHRNFCIAHLLAENDAFPSEMDINDIVEFYLKQCRLEDATSYII